jgi:hypothetical protein
LWFPALIAASLLVGVWMIRATPDPYIDVVEVHKEAIKALIHHRDPYRISFANIYESEDSRKFYNPEALIGGRLAQAYPYPPPSLLLAAPGHVLLGDYRYSELALLLAAAALIGFAYGTLPRHVETGEELGDLLSKRAVAALGIDGAKAHSYGKAAAVGENGELEHAAAILHPKMGAPVRKVLSKGAALIPSSKKRSGPGTTLDIPLGHKDAAFVRSHFDGMEVQINDAPRANEIMVAVAVTDSGRPLPRVGGLTVAEIKGEDGLR